MYYNLTQFAIVLSLPLTASFVDALEDRWGTIARFLRATWEEHKARAEEIRQRESLARLSEHVLRDIGAPESLLADAVTRRQVESVRRFELDRGIGL